MAKKAATDKAGARSGGAAARAPAKRSAKPKRASADAETEPQPAPIEVPRPGELTRMVGHGRAIGTLGAAFSSGRVHHAWIFAGPRGVGKFTAALGFAAAALDPTTKIGADGIPRPDPTSRVQGLLRAGTHPDFHVVVKELARFSDNSKVREAKLRTISVDVLKQHVIEPIELSATLNEGGRASKVFIIDEAERIDHIGQNQLLKTLEEPAPGSLLILVTSAEERLFATVRSRCQRVGFAPLSTEEMRRWMETSDAFGERGGRGMEARTLAWMLSVAGGSPGVLIEALERGMAEWGPTLAPMLDRVVAGEYVVELGPALAGISETLASTEVARNPNASKETANRDAGRLLLHIMAERVRRSLLGSAGDHERLERGASAIDAIGEAEEFIDKNVGPLFAMESAVVGIARAMGRAR